MEQETLEEAAELVAKKYAINKQNDNTSEYYIALESFIKGAKWQQEQILEFLYLEIIERRDYSASKMCEQVIEFIEKLPK